MERRIYVTLVDGEVSRYVLGRITGMLTAICKEDPASNAGYGIYKVGEYSDGVKEHSHYGLIEKTTEEEYAKFKAIVEALYPDACKFDVDVKF